LIRTYVWYKIVVTIGGVTIRYEYIRMLKDCNAFVPCYLQHRGKVTKLYFSSGECDYVDYSTAKVLKDYCAINMRCMRSIKKRCQNITGRKNIVPLYIKETGILLPVKTILPRAEGDKCIGYVNMQEIERIHYENREIKLKSGQRIFFLERAETVKKRIGDCEAIKLSFEEAPTP